MKPLKIGIFGQFYHDDADIYLRKLLEIIKRENAQASIEKKFFKSLKKRLPEPDIILEYPVFENLDKSFDLFLSIGGDGTMLKTISKIKDLGVPLAGINTGRLGFLASIPKDAMDESVTKILRGDYTCSQRSLLSVSVTPENEDITKLNFALNDVGILRKNTTSMIKIEAFSERRIPQHLLVRRTNNFYPYRVNCLFFELRRPHYVSYGKQFYTYSHCAS